MSLVVSSKNRLPVRLYRAMRIALHLYSGVFEVALLFPLYGKSRRRRAIGRWSARLSPSHYSAAGTTARWRGWARRDLAG